MDEPRTAAGRALLDAFFTWDGGMPDNPGAAILAIEREAAEAARAEVVEPVPPDLAHAMATHNPIRAFPAGSEVAEPGDGPGSDQWDVRWLVSDTGRDPIDGRWLVHTAGASVIADVVSERHARWIAATWNAALSAATAGREPLDALRLTDAVLAFFGWHEMSRDGEATRWAGYVAGIMAEYDRAALDTPDPGAS